MKKSLLYKTILMFFLLTIFISCSTAEKTKKESKVEEICRQAFEITMKTTKPDINDYMSNYDLFIRDYPDFEKIIARGNFEDDGLRGQLEQIGVVSLLGGMARVYAVYGLNMSDEEIEKMLGEKVE